MSTKEQRLRKARRKAEAEAKKPSAFSKLLSKIGFKKKVNKSGKPSIAEQINFGNRNKE